MRKHLNLIQFSRAFVPTFVILFHAKAFMNVYFDYDFLNLPDVIKSGGMYYFFALSGFMVYYLYEKDFGNASKIKSFLYNRLIRIYPVYWILAVCVLPAYFIFPSLGVGYERELSSILTSLLLLPSTHNPYFGVAWSLVHTVFFYYIFSIVFIKSKMIKVTVFVVWGILSFLIGVKILNSYNYVIDFLFNFNNLIFLCGMFCAYAIKRVKINHFLSVLLVILGICGFPFSWINEQFSFIAIDLQYTTTISSILLIVGFSSIDIQKDIKIPKIAKFLGDASFSIYLSHYYFMAAITLALKYFAVTFIPNLIIVILLILLSTVGGCFVYVFIEKPLHRKLKAIEKAKRNGFITKLDLN